MKDIEDKIIDNIRRLFHNKSVEYATGDDLFKTIRAVASVNKVTPARMCMILSSKHFISLLQDVDTLTPVQRRDKINDIHLYIEYANELVNKG